MAQTTLLKGGSGREVLVTTIPRLRSTQVVAVTFDVGRIDGVSITAISGAVVSLETQAATLTLSATTPTDSLELTAAAVATAAETPATVTYVPSDGLTLSSEPGLLVRVVGAIRFRIRAFLEGALQ